MKSRHRLRERLVSASPGWVERAKGRGENEYRESTKSKQDKTQTSEGTQKANDMPWLHINTQRRKRWREGDGKSPSRLSVKGLH